MEMDDRENAPIYEFYDAVDYIAERCDVDRDTVEKVLLLDGDYIEEHNGEPIWDFDGEIVYIAEKSDIDLETVEKVMVINEDYFRSIGVVDELPESMVEQINEIIREKNEKKK